MGFVDAQILPDVDGLVVVLEYGHIQLLERKLQLAHGEVQRPGAHLALEVLAEAEVAQHLEEAQMATIRADDVDVVRAYALLYRGGADIAVVQVLLLQEVRLELHHARAGKQQAGIIGDQRRRRHTFASLALEIAQVLFPDFGRCHVSHSFNSPDWRSNCLPALQFPLENNHRLY